MKLMADPWRDPLRGVLSSLNGFLSIKDLLKIGLMRLSITKGKIDQLFDGGDGTTLDFLQKRKLSDKGVGKDLDAYKDICSDHELPEFDQDFDEDDESTEEMPRSVGFAENFVSTGSKEELQSVSQQESDDVPF